MSDRTGAAARTALVRLFADAVAALEPRRLVCALLARERDRLRPVLARARRDGVVIVGAGKGAAGLAAALETELGACVVDGLVIVPPGHRCRTRVVDVRIGGHPLPDRRSVAATRALLAVLARHRRRAVLVVVTGGASSLLALPAPGVTLADKRRTHALLVESGATIAEINTVRTQLSAVKGGGLAARLRGRVAAAVVLSDVPGDDLAVVGSGPTIATAPSVADALRIVRAHGLEGRLPARVWKRLLRGRARRGAGASTAPTGRRSLPTLLLAGNATACAAAACAARARGYRPVLRSRVPLTGDVHDAAARLASHLGALRRRATSATPAALVLGGETTVRLTGARHGRGGRNQELALEVARRLAGEPGWMLLCAGTDGIDGPTDAAGAWVDGHTVLRARRAGFDVAAALAGHDVYPMLAAIGALHRTGPTGTNVADVALALVWRAYRDGRRWRLAGRV